MNASGIFGLFKETFSEWSKDKAPRLGAALAYYTIFSIGPLLLVAIAIAGLVLGDAAAQGKVVSTISTQVGPAGAEVIQGAIKSASKPSTTIIATVIGVVTLLLGASGIFGQLQDALNTVWKTEPPKTSGVLGMVKSRILPFLMLLGTALLLIASLVITSLLSVLSDLLKDKLPGGPIPWQIADFVVSAGVLTLAFAMIFKFLPNRKIAWSDVWVGAALTSVLFTLGQILLSVYLGFSNVGSAYGAAGSLVVILVWIYYSAQILLFGAEFTRVYAEQHGTLAAQPRRAVGRYTAQGGQVASPWFK